MNKELLHKLVKELRDERENANTEYENKMFDLRSIVLQKTKHIYLEIEPLRGLQENENYLIVGNKSTKIISCLHEKNIMINNKLIVCSSSTYSESYIYGHTKEELMNLINILDDFIANDLNNLIEEYLVEYNNKTTDIKLKI